MPLSLPTAAEREGALRLSCAGLRVDGAVSLRQVAGETNGYSAADLVALTREAALGAARRCRLLGAAALGPAKAAAAAAEEVEAASATEEEAAPLRLLPDDFAGAMQRVRASVLRPSDSAAPPVEPLSWSEVGGIEEVKRRIRRAIEWPVLHAAAYRALGITTPRGVLLHGPPGCAKTSLARAAAGATGVSFTYLSGATLYSPYVGEAERQLREAFSLCRSCAPAILFIDELDAIVGNRGSGGGDGGGAGEGVQLRVLSTLLNEMDGVSATAQIVLIGATNRPDALDAALLRPGRFDEVIEVPLPDAAGRAQVLAVHTRRMPLASGVDLQAIADGCPGWSGAQLSALCREAAMEALRESVDAPLVAPHHFEAAALKVHRSV